MKSDFFYKGIKISYIAVVSIVFFRQLRTRDGVAVCASYFLLGFTFHCLTFN